MGNLRKWFFGTTENVNPGVSEILQQARQEKSEQENVIRFTQLAENKAFLKPEMDQLVLTCDGCGKLLPDAVKIYQQMKTDLGITPLVILFGEVFGNDKMNPDVSYIEKKLNSEGISDDDVLVVNPGVYPMGYQFFKEMLEDVDYYQEFRKGDFDPRKTSYLFCVEERNLDNMQNIITDYYPEIKAFYVIH